MISSVQGILNLQSDALSLQYSGHTKQPMHLSSGIGAMPHSISIALTEQLETQLLHRMRFPARRI
jgi:hypothetical protein